MIRIFVFRVIFTFILFYSFNYARAQNLHVKPLSISELKVPVSDLFLYVSSGQVKYANLWTANSNVLTSKDNLYGTHIDVGFGIEQYRANNSVVNYGITVGYKYEIYRNNKRLRINSGVKSHWISTDLYINFIHSFGIGFKSDFFLKSRIRNNDHFTYEGINPECFNKITYCWYGSFGIRFTKLKFEVRAGSYIKPRINPNKVSYYNLTKTHVDGLYFELKFYYRIFSTGKVHNAPSLF